MRSRSSVALCLVLTLLLVGCSGPAGSTGGTATGEPANPSTPTSTPGPTPVESTDTTSTADLRTGTGTSPSATDVGGPVAYADLSPLAQRAFDAARDGTVVLGPDSRYLDGVDFHWSVRDAFESADGGPRYVLKNGTRYAPFFDVETGVAQYVIEAERVDGDAIENVTAHDDLPTNVSDEVRWAIENGSYATPWGQWYSLPRPLDGLRYVRYEGTVYELTYAVGDGRLIELRMRPA